MYPRLGRRLFELGFCHAIVVSAMAAKSAGSRSVLGFGGVMRGLGLAGIGLIVLVGGARAADLSAVLPTKAPPPPAPVAYDWSGFYLGGHVGYALGGSNWSATQAGSATPSLSGTVSLSNAYNFSSGTGSYLLGFQAGYDRMVTSHWLVGVVADVSVPDFVGGTTTFSSPLVGTANYLDRVEFSGSLRGRVGYAPIWAPATGCSTPPAAWRSATTNLPARNSQVSRSAAPLCRERSRTRF